MTKTVVFVFILVTAVFLFDVFIIAKMGSQESISAYIIRWSHEYPSIPFLMGYLAGHLFWRMKDNSVYAKKEEK